MPSDAYTSKLNKYGLIIGFTLLALVGLFVQWIYAQHGLTQSRGEAFTRFKTVKEFKPAYKLPDPIYIANPLGEQYNLSDTQGRWTVLNIWATWCAPCVRELPSLKKLDMALDNKEWRVIALSIDSAANLPKVAAFADRYDVVDVAAYHDYNLNFQNTMNVKNVPTTYIIRPSGRVMYEISGEAVWHDADIVKFLRDLKASYPLPF